MFDIQGNRKVTKSALLWGLSLARRSPYARRLARRAIAVAPRSVHDRVVAFVERQLLQKRLLDAGIEGIAPDLRGRGVKIIYRRLRGMTNSSNCSEMNQ